MKMFLCSEGGKIRNRRNFVACAGPGEGRLSTPLLPFIDLTLDKTAGWVAGLSLARISSALTPSTSASAPVIGSVPHKGL